MGKAYSNLFEVIVDTTLYIGLVNKTTPTLGYFATVAKNRWTWIADNWTTLRPRFAEQILGDEKLTQHLQDFDSAVQTYFLGNRQNALQINANYEKFFTFLANIPLSDVGLTADEQGEVQIELSRVSKLDITDFRNMLAFVKSNIATRAALVGKGDVDGGPLFGGQDVRMQRDSTFDDLLQLDLLIQLEQSVEGIIFALMQVQARPPNLLQMANDNIESGSAVSIKSSYKSYRAIPFQLSLEDMAQRYLGSSTRWFELVTVNKLMPPYIDEFGSKHRLIAPGGSNNVTILSTSTKDVYIGCKIRLGSITVREETRIVENKVENSDGTMILTLSGEPNLFQLRPSEQAYVRIYKPGTVNSGSIILVPYDVRSTILSAQTPNSDVLRRLDQDLLAFGVDFRRDETTGDFIVDASGNFAMAYGLENVRQTIFWMLRTEPGELPFHRTFGLDAGLGNLFFGTESEMSKIANTIKQNILRDRRFRSVSVTRMVASGTSISFEVLVSIGNSSLFLPLAFAF